MNKGFIKLICILPLTGLFQSCCMPAAYSPNGAFPQSVTETHTKTTLVMPPSYATVNMPPPSISQAAPVIQQPVMMTAPACAPSYQAPMQSSPCQSYYSSNPCAPSQLGAYDPCAYQVSVPQQAPQKYTIAIPPAPAPQYTIALPQGNPPQYAVVQQQPSVTAKVPVKLQSHEDRCIDE